jgi:type III restriction enzyme
MKLQFKHQSYQADAVEAVVDCFAGQPKVEGLSYRLDPGRLSAAQAPIDYGTEAFRNAPLIEEASLLENIRSVQRRRNLPQSKRLVATRSAKINLDVEMETGTGKTYVYLRTMFELNRRYGWSKFIVVVPSIAIREGVQKSLEITADHFLQDYGKKARFFTYDSKHLHKLESFSSDGGINVMVINVQAFNARGADARRIDMELDDFQSRRPIEVIRANHPILILDEPQKMEGRQTAESLAKFNPLFVVRYSATHKTEHNKVYRLDALDAYQQKLVKKIRVHGIAQKGLSGTNGYLYLEGLAVSPKETRARLEFEVKDKSGTIRRVLRKVGVGDNLRELSNGLGQYDGFVVSEIDVRQNTLAFTNGQVIVAGQVHGEVHESHLRRIQIRETIRAHFEQEKRLFPQGIKVLSLFFIDAVAKYRRYDENGEQPGEYAKIFEEEYAQQLNEALELEDTPYQCFLREIPASSTHNGYFSIDRRSNRLVDPSVRARGEDAGLADDVDAYDLILRDKETLLSFPENNDRDDVRRRKQVRFIFSHSALREGWDNPNVFTICTLKHSDSTVSRRQEVGRGMRLCVNQFGERMDQPATVHDINILTVIANESYEDFVNGLQSDIHESLSARPRKASEAYFTGKVLIAGPDQESITVTPELAKQIYRYLLKNDYTDEQDHITEVYHQAKKDGTVAELPEDLKPHAAEVFRLIDSVFSEGALPQYANHRMPQKNVLNENFHKKEFQELWQKINRKAAYTVKFDSAELIDKAIKTLNRDLRVEQLRFQITRGEQADQISPEDLAAKQGFVATEREAEYGRASMGASVTYDLIGSVAEATQLTRHTVAAILRGLEVPVFGQFKTNPEAFLSRASTLIKEQKATMIIEHIAYDPIDERYDSSIFTAVKEEDDFGDAFEAKRHIYNYVFTDSKVERRFAEELDTNAEVIVYSKLPRGFAIPTPVGDYNPDWAIAFRSGDVRHVYFIAETKGSMSSLELREIESARINCARKFFARITSNEVKYEVVRNYGELMEIVR